MNIADPILGLDPQALAVLAALSGLEAPEDLECTTSAWYNCRERGIVLTVRKGYIRPAIHITIANQRISDGIVVSHWLAPTEVNPPTVNDRPEAAYDAEVSFRWLDLKGVVAHVQGLLEAFKGPGTEVQTSEPSL